MVAEVFLQGHEFGIGGGGVANHYFSSRLSKNSRAVARAKIFLPKVFKNYPKSLIFAILRVNQSLKIRAKKWKSRRKSLRINEQNSLRSKNETFIIFKHCALSAFLHLF